MIVIVQFSNK